MPLRKSIITLGENRVNLILHVIQAKNTCKRKIIGVIFYQNVIK